MGRERVVVVVLVLVACCSPSVAGKRSRVPEPPERFDERWYAVSRPPGEGWALMQRSEDGVAMAREGKAPDESYAAAVGVSQGDPALSPEDFVRHVEAQHRATLGTGRYALRAFSAALDGKRKETCLRYLFATVDSAPERVTGGSEPMLLEGVGITCQVPGGAPVYLDAHWSHRTERGREDPRLAADADAWLGTLVLKAAARDATAEPAADGPEAWLREGERHLHGDGVPKDPAKALELCRRAAEAGLASAQVETGWFYESGTGVAEDLAEARRWFELAAAQGHPVGKFNLAMLLDDGKGGPVDDARAVKLYREAAEAGEARAQVNLGVQLWRGEGAPRDVPEALAWLNVAIITSSDAEARDAATAALRSFSARASRDERRRGQEKAIAWLESHGYTSAAAKVK